MSTASSEPTHRRRLDQVLAADFTETLDVIDPDVLSERRLLAHEVENELSYYRRLLHGRLDLLRFEQRRRRGEETRTLIEALPEILADPDREGEPRARHIYTDLPPLPDIGRREVDQVLGDDVLTRLDEIDDEDLETAVDAIIEIEAEISNQRKMVQDVVDTLAAELSSRYRAQRRPSS